MHDTIEKIATTTPDLSLERQEQLRQLFPEAWSEGRLDWDKLRQTLGDLSDERPERYVFSWAGKRDALQLLQTPSRATLRPVPDESLDWDATQNLFIEGDNLEALKLLYKPLFGRVKMIYIDPPYNTGNDFVYPDNFADPLKNYLIQTGQKDANGDLQLSNPDVAGRVHSRWLSMLYPRLFLARQLLKDDGVIFVSIDDNEVHHLRLLMNEVFGEENFLGNIVWKKKTNGNNMGYIPPVHDFIVAYRRSGDAEPLQELPLSAEYVNARFSNPDNDLRGDWTITDLSANHVGPYFAIKNPVTDEEFYPPAGRYWVFSEAEVAQRIEAGRIIFGRNGRSRPVQRKFKSEMSLSVKAESWWDGVAYNSEGTQELGDLVGVKVFDNPKPAKLLKQLIRIGANKDDIILDFFSGSGTTAQAVLELNREDGGNRRFVLVQLPEPTGNASFPTIADIGKERIRRVVARMKDSNGTLDLSTRETPEDLGFKVWKLGESHFRPMQATTPGDTAAYLEQLELMNDPLLPGWEARGVLSEIALKEGYGLNARLEVVPDVTGAKVWRVSDDDKGQTLFACLDDSLSLDALRPLNLSADHLFICRGVSLDDTLAANLALQCRLKMI